MCAVIAGNATHLYPPFSKQENPLVRQALLEHELVRAVDGGVQQQSCGRDELLGCACKVRHVLQPVPGAGIRRDKKSKCRLRVSHTHATFHPQQRLSRRALGMLPIQAASVPEGSPFALTGGYTA